MTVACGFVEVFGFVSFASIRYLRTNPAHFCCVVGFLAVHLVWVFYCPLLFCGLFFTLSFLVFANAFPTFFADMVWFFFSIVIFLIYYLLLIRILWLVLLDFYRCCCHREEEEFCNCFQCAKFEFTM